MYTKMKQRNEDTTVLELLCIATAIFTASLYRSANINVSQYDFFPFFCTRLSPSLLKDRETCLPAPGPSFYGCAVSDASLRLDVDGRDMDSYILALC